MTYCPPILHSFGTCACARELPVAMAHDEAKTTDDMSCMACDDEETSEFPTAMACDEAETSKAKQQRTESLPVAPLDPTHAVKKTRYRKGSRVVVRSGKRWSTACGTMGCSRSARSGDGIPDMCKQHGGGNRCKHPDCPNSAEPGDGIPGMCIKHGGGNRCKHPDCPHSAHHRDDDLRWLCVDHAISAGLIEATKPGVSRMQSHFFDDWREKTGEKVPWRVTLRKGLDPIGEEKPDLLPEHPRMKPDGFSPPGLDDQRKGSRGTVFQFHGNYIHGFPPWHEKHETHIVGGKWGPDAFNETWEKMRLYHDAGYAVKYIWECDYDRTRGRCPVPLTSVVFTFPHRPDLDDH